MNTFVTTEMCLLLQKLQPCLACNKSDALGSIKEQSITLFPPLQNSSSSSQGTAVVGDLPPTPSTNGADDSTPKPKTGKGSGKGRKPGQRITTEAEKAKTSATMKGRGLSQEHKK